MPNLLQFSQMPLTAEKTVLLVVVLLWMIFWKGLALWHSAKRGENKWFIVILVINTFSILELVYLFYVVKIKSIKLE